MTTIALMGAGGKMGCRLTDNLKDHLDYKMLYVEVSPTGLERMAQRGVSPTPAEESLARAEVVILAVPDALIGKISREIVPQLRPGTMIMGLDPAAGYAGVFPERADVSYFAAHPCHPPLFMEELTREAQTDWFGGYHARQSVVCALNYRGRKSTIRWEKRSRRPCTRPFCGCTASRSSRWRSWNPASWRPPVRRLSPG